jgi:hypothetical protein
LVLDEQAILDESAHDAGDDVIQEFFQVLLVWRVLNGSRDDSETSTERIWPTGEKQSQRPGISSPTAGGTPTDVPVRQE